MTARARLPKTSVRSWVAIYTPMLTDPELLLAGNASRLMVPLLLLWSAQQGSDGVLPGDMRQLNVICRLDGGLEETKAAVDALLEMEFLLDPGDGTLIIRNWAKYQADFGGSATRGDAVRKHQFRKAHEAGKHSDAPREGCEQCGITSAVLSVVPDPDPEETTTASSLRSSVWERCDKALELAAASGFDPLDAYLAVYEDAVAASDKYATVKGIGDATLPNVVVSHAAHTYLTRDGIAPSDGLVRSLHGLRKEHGADVLTKLPSAGQARNPLAYIKGCYRTEVAS